MTDAREKLRLDPSDDDVPESNKFRRYLDAREYKVLSKMTFQVAKVHSLPLPSGIVLNVI